MRAHRLDRVASTIRDVVSDAIQRRLNDPRITPLTSVTRVEVSGDLMFAKVHISIMGTDGQKRQTMDGLRHGTRYVQSLLAKHLSTRHCPRLTFVFDPSIQKAIETNRIIDQTMAEYAGGEQAPQGPQEAPAADDQGDDE